LIRVIMPRAEMNERRESTWLGLGSGVRARGEGQGLGPGVRVRGEGQGLGSGVRVRGEGQG
jgi:hypothetical protein